MHGRSSYEPHHGAPAVGVVDSPLPQIDAAAAAVHVGLERLLRWTIAALDWGGVPAATGCSVGDYLRIEAGLPGWLAGQLESVARRIDAVPAVAELFWAGVLSFDQLAGFVRASASHNGQLLARLDGEAASLAEALAEQGRLHGWTPQVEFLLEDLRAPGHLERAERRAVRGRRTVIAQDLDGGGYVHHDLDKVGLTTYVAALDAEADPDETSRQRARADAAVRIAEQRLGGTTSGGAPRPARPTVVWHVDVADATTDRFAQQLRVASGGDGRLVPVTVRLLASLADHADHVLQLRDGHRPLDELAVRADDIPVKVRRTVLRRDRGCRFPGCRRPLVHLHHIVPRARGGPHTPDNLIAVCALHHLRHVHRHRWSIDHDPTSGSVTWTNRRTGTAVTSLPNGTRPVPARDPAAVAGWLAPPRPPPPAAADPPAVPASPDHWTDPPADLATALRGPPRVSDT